MKEVEKIELIEKSYRGELSEEEKNQLETLEMDSLFLEEKDEYEELFKGFDALHLDYFQGQLMTWEAEAKQKVQIEETKPLQHSSPKPLRSFFRYYAAAAIVFLLMTPIAWQYLPSGTSNLQQELFQPLSATVLRGVEEETKESKLHKSILVYYNNKKYTEVITKGRIYLKDYNSEAQDIRYFLGVSLYAQDKYQEAYTEFVKMEQNESSYSQEGYFMQALSLYRMGKTTESTHILENILKKPTHIRFAQAQKLILEIKK